MIEPRKPIRYLQVGAERQQPVEGSTIVEAPVSLTVNGEAWVSFMCIPLHLEALAIGFLFNEGVIQNIEEVADVRACAHGDNVDVWLTRTTEKPLAWRRTSGCTGGVTAVESESEGFEPIPLNGSLLEAGRIGRLVEMLFESQELYRETGGVHTSALSDGERIVLAVEDIGRHNTLDKIAGLCLLEDIWPELRILITTGRVSSEMLQKAVRLRVPILVSRTSPTSLSIDLAERLGVTLIGYARRRGFNLYAHPERIRVTVR